MLFGALFLCFNFSKVIRQQIQRFTDFWLNWIYITTIEEVNETFLDKKEVDHDLPCFNFLFFLSEFKYFCGKLITSCLCPGMFFCYFCKFCIDWCHGFTLRHLRFPPRTIHPSVTDWLQVEYWYLRQFYGYQILQGQAVDKFKFFDLIEYGTLHSSYLKSR